MKVKLLANTSYGKKGSIVEVSADVAKAYGEKYMEIQEVEGKELKKKTTKEVKNGETK